MLTDWVVWSFEHAAWWGPNYRGYVRDLAQAGRYTELDALRIEHDANVAEDYNELAMSLKDAERRGPPRLPPFVQDQPEHQDAAARGLSAEAGDCHRHAESRETETSET